MVLSEKFVRAQLHLMNPLLDGCSLETSRKGQDALGQLMAAARRKEVTLRRQDLSACPGAWAVPKEEIFRGAVLYLHGGGYTCGDLEYAQGFASVLAGECGIRVYCPAYRLAPEFPFPAALEDALSAYQFLLDSGLSPQEIVLAGESAGGGLIYALCLKLKELGLPLPAGLLAISPWTDLTASGPSYETNRQADPSMSAARLDFFASCYTTDRTDPLVSPLFGDLAALPPSLIFVGGDEIMLDDARLMHQALEQAGCQSRLVVAPRLWHGYVLYGLKERKTDYAAIRAFFKAVLPPPRKLRWMRLDNAAKIYPAAKRKNWSNLFRLSFTLSEPVDRDVLQAALDVTVRRFPSMAVRLRRGVFWYYLEELPQAPRIREEQGCPLRQTPFDRIRQCAFRVLVYENRIAVEFFHAITDGTGGLTFLKSLTAEYLKQRYGTEIPPEDGVLDRLEEPDPEELEDSFLRYSGPVSLSRQERTSYHLHGTPEGDDFFHVTTLMLDSDAVYRAAKAQGVTVTAFLCAVMMQALIKSQDARTPRRRQRPLKVMLPVNLRSMFDSRSLRNFALYVTPEIDPRMGEYSFDELCRSIHHQMGAMITPKQMQARITTNVNSERIWILRAMPLFIKNLAMKLAFDLIGERKACLCLSNMGQLRVPQTMVPYLRRADFVLGVQARAPYNCGAVSYDGTLYLSFIRNTREPELESLFYGVLRDLGLSVKAESNQR